METTTHAACRWMIDALAHLPAVRFLVIEADSRLGIR
jgi:hypothetical protein